MNYQWHYARLVERAETRVLEGYVERHHVVPRCMGGGDEPENIVRLTPEEHYVAHQLLVKMHPGNVKLLWAVSAMAGATGRMKARNNRMYGWLRRRFSEAVAEASRGRKHTDEARAKMSASRLGKKRGSHSAETKAKMSAAAKGRKKSPEHCAAMAAAKLGKKTRPRTEAEKQKIRESNKRAAATRDWSQWRTDEYRARQQEQMKRVWTERKAQKEG